MATKVLNITIQLRRGTTSEWTEYGAVVPAMGEPCLDTTTGHLRFGDGVTSYKDLPDIAELHGVQLEALKQTVGNDTAGLVKDVQDILTVVGAIPAGAQSNNIVDYMRELQAAEHPNKTVLDGITQTKVNAWNKGEANVIEHITVNGSEVPVTNKTAAIVVSAEDGSTPLPEVTTADNGKFLRVVNGAWAAEALQDVSEEGM